MIAGVDLIQRVRVLSERDRARVLTFWMAQYGLDERFVRCDDPHVELYAYFRSGELIGTVAFRHAEDGRVFHHALPETRGVVEVSKLCIARGHRDLMRRICEDVHSRLVLSGRCCLAIAAPRWLRARYRFIGFRGTGVRFPIPGVDGESLEIMLSCQKRFGTYGLHTDPIRWNLFLRNVTDRLIAARALHHGRWQRAILTVYRWFAPLAALIERRMIWRRA